MQCITHSLGLLEFILAMFCGLQHTDIKHLCHVYLYLIFFNSIVNGILEFQTGVSISKYSWLLCIDLVSRNFAELTN